MNHLISKIGLVRRTSALASLIHILYISPLSAYIVGSKLNRNEAPLFFSYSNVVLEKYFYSVLILTSVLLLFVILRGVSNRFVSLGVYLLVTSIEFYLFPVVDGGSNLLQLVLFYLIFPNEKKSSEIERYISQKVIFLIQFQVAIMYLTTGVLKLVAPFWQNGVAIFYTLTSVEYSVPWVANFIWNSHPIIYVVPNYLVLLFQLTFPLSLINLRVKNWYLIIGVIFHLFIATVIGLPTFALQVVATYPIFFDGKLLEKALNLENWLSSVVDRSISWVRGMISGAILALKSPKIDKKR